MYNVSKGGNTLEESEILEPIHTCLRELLEVDKQGKGHLIQYTDHDIVAITVLFSNILGNRLIHKMTDEKVSLGFSQATAKSYGRMIQELALAMTGVDLIEHFKDNK
jgi:hypothetical protein